MLHAFLDESYTDARYYMGAVVVDDAHVSALDAWRADDPKIYSPTEVPGAFLPSSDPN